MTSVTRISVAASLILFAAFATLAWWKFQSKKNLKHENAIREKIAQIPSEDRKNITRFLTFVVFQSSFGYVLFGDKPMAFEEFIETDDIPREYFRSYTDVQQGLKYYVWQRGIKAWEKYQHLFPSNHFRLIVKKAQKPGDTTTVILIRKSAFESTVLKYRQDFETTLRQKVSPEGLLADFYNRGFGEALDHHPALLGILLGYGRNNAWHYFNWIESKRQRPSKSERNNFVPLPFSKAPHPHLELSILLPGFGCDPNSEETKELRQKYGAQRHRIYEAYQGNDFLEVTLKKLTE